MYLVIKFTPDANDAVQDFTAKFAAEKLRRENYDFVESIEVMSPLDMACMEVDE